VKFFSIMCITVAIAGIYEVGVGFEPRSPNGHAILVEPEICMIEFNPSEPIEAHIDLDWCLDQSSPE
jgi:hypothetical protein